MANSAPRRAPGNRQLHFEEKIYTMVSEGNDGLRPPDIALISGGEVFI